MRIFDTQDAMTALWQIVAPLAQEIPIYKQVMDEDENSVPESYLIIRTDIYDDAEVYGDGHTELRKNGGDIILVSKSTGTRSDDIHTLNRVKVKKLLDEADMAYTGINLGYDSALKQSEYTWSVTLIYG